QDVVTGFLVDDLDAAASALRTAGSASVTEPTVGGAVVLQHFRGVDGLIVGLITAASCSRSPTPRPSHADLPLPPCRRPCPLPPPAGAPHSSTGARDRTNCSNPPALEQFLRFGTFHPGAVAPRRPAQDRPSPRRRS